MIILHYIIGLGDGGAEAVLYRLCTHDRKNKHIIISMLDLGKYGALFKDFGIDVYTLNMKPGRLSIKGVLETYKLIRKIKPDVLQTWMYQADLIGGIIGKICGVKKIYWNVRHTTLVPGKSKTKTIYVARFCGFLSRFIPSKIICCAQKCIPVHQKIGYQQKKMMVINNGYDLGVFKPDEQLRANFRSENGIEKNIFLMGMVGRFDPQKDHVGLISALKIVKSKGLSFKFMLIGKNLDSNNNEILFHIKENNLENEIILLGQRKNIAQVMNGLDLHILSSAYGEAFPNVLAEAMACGTPCVATNVGDAEKIISGQGWLSAASDENALASKIIEAHAMYSNTSEWLSLKERVRKRVEENYSIDSMVSGYCLIWQQ
jgi:glycosyltransferase involved in cell wall biosynthesis